MTTEPTGAAAYGTHAYAGDGFLPRFLPGPGFVLPAWKVEVAFAANVNDPISSMVWTDITPWVRKVDTQRGKQHERDVVQAGTATFLLDNRDGRFSPWNTSSPYSPNVLPMRPIRITATWAGVTYAVWFGYVEGWPQKWKDAVNNEVEVRAVDGFKLLAMKDLGVGGNYYGDIIRADNPTVYWPLSEATAGSGVSDASGHGHLGSIFGIPTFGTAGALTSEPTNTAVTFGDGKEGQGYIDGGTVAPTGTGDFTVECWVQLAGVPGSGLYILLASQPPTAPPYWTLGLNNTTGTPVLAYDTLFGGAVTTSTNVADGRWHHIAVTRASGTFTIYVDAVEAGTGSSSENYPVGSKLFIASEGVHPYFPGSLDEVAVYPTALSASRINIHYRAGKGFQAERSSDRINRVLDLAGIASADRNIETGKSVLGDETRDLSSTKALAYLQEVELTESGLFFIDAQGRVCFYNRYHTMTAPTSTTSQVTFGGAPGEEPYRLDGTDVGMDDADIWNEANVTRSGGTPQTAVDTASQAQYGKRTLTVSLPLAQSDPAANDLAHWLVLQYKNPQSRVGAVNIDLRSDPAVLFPKILGLDLLDRVTFKRETLDGGSTFQADQLLEGIEHHITPSTWHATPHLAPVDPNTYWIVGTSRAGIDTRAAY